MKRCILIVLCFFISVIISSCGGKDGKSENYDNSDVNPAIGNTDDTHNSISNEQPIIDMIKEISVKVSTDEMNNYIQHYSGMVPEGTIIHFTDSFFHYSFDTESKELRKAPCKNKSSGAYYDGIIIDGFQFNLRGQIRKSENLSDAFAVELVDKETNTNYSIGTCSSVVPYGEYIYILCDTEIDEGGEVVFRAPIKSAKEMSNNVTYGDEVFRVIELGDWQTVIEENGIDKIGLYGDYVVAVTDDCDFWVVDLKTMTANQIINGSELSPYGTGKTFAVDGDYIYFTNDEDTRFERIKFDGTDRQVFLEGMNGAGRELFNISGGYLYHVDFDESDCGCLYRTALSDPLDQIEIVHGEDRGISVTSDPIPCIVGDWVYYGSLSYGYWRAKTDGSLVEFITYAAYSLDEPEWDVEKLEKHNIAAGYEHTVAIQPDGTVLATGANEYNQCDVSEWTDIISVYAASGRTIGIKSDGTFCAAGIMTSVYGYANCVDYDVTPNAILAVRGDGTVVCNARWSSDIETWTDIVSATSGFLHTIGLKKGGTVVAAGDNSNGQCDVYDWSDIVEVAAGDDFSVGLKSDGTVVTAGNIESLGWTDIVSVSASSHNVIGLKRDGTVITNNENLESWSDVVEVSAGGAHYVGLCSDGTVLSAGNNYYDQCETGEWVGLKTGK